MRAITNLVPWSTGTYNNVYSGCCNHEFEVEYVLDPGEADHEIDFAYAYTFAAGSAIEILEIGGIPYSTSFSGTSFADLSPNFILTQGNSLIIKYKFCPNVAINGTCQIQLTLTCNNHAIPDHNFSYKFRGRDSSTVYNTFISETAATFTNCVNDCTAITDLLHLNNPSSLPIPTTSSLSTTCGFYFYINGVPINITDFQIPVGQSVLQIQNPSCSVSSQCDFGIDFNFCGNTLSIPITHLMLDCDTCGISCEGILIQTSNNPGVELPITPAWASGSLFLTQFTGSQFSPWWIQSSDGLFTNTIISGNSVKIELTAWGAGTYYAELRPQSGFNFSANFNNGDNLIFHIKFTTGVWDNPTSTAYIVAPYLTGGTWNIPFPGGYIQPNTTYDITTTIPSFVIPPIVISGDEYITIAVNSATVGEKYEVLNVQFTLQDAATYQLLDPTNMNCSDMSLYNQTAIGDSKMITYTLNYNNGWDDNTQLWFNPWLYSATGDFSPISGGNTPHSPGKGFMIDAQASWIGDGTLHQMNLIAGGREPSQQNGYAWIQIINRTEFKVYYFFYVIQDATLWVADWYMDNHRKLLYTDVNEPTELTITHSSVYNSNRKLASLFYIYDPNIIVGSTSTLPPKNIYYECNATKFVYFTNRFWNMGIGGGQSEMSNPIFTLSRNSQPVNNLSIFQSTEIEFLVDNTLGNIDYILFWMFDVTQFNNNINFYDNYDSSRAIIPDIAGSGSIIDNHFISPSSAAVNVGGDTFRVSCNIDNNLNPNSQFRIGAVCYDNGNKIVNSFLSPVYTVSSIPDIGFICSDLDKTIEWQDYKLTHSGECFSPSIKERVKNYMTINSGSFNSVLLALGMNPMTNTWLDYMEGLTFNIYRRVDNTPSIGQSLYINFKQISVQRGVSFLDNWDNTDPELYIADDGTTLTTQWIGRVDYETTQPSTWGLLVGPMNQYGNRTLYGPNALNWLNAHPSVTNNWGGDRIYFEYNFVFDITPLTGYLSKVILTQINVLDPAKEEILPDPYPSLDFDIQIYGVKIPNSPELITMDQICKDQYDYLIVKTSSPYAPLDDFIAIFEKYPYTMANLFENNTSTGNMQQLIAAELYDVDTNFNSSGEAYYKVDLSMLGQGTYKFSGLRIV